MSSEIPGLDVFSACVGDVFELSEGDRAFVAELIEAKPLGEVPDRPFALLFRVEEGPLLPQRIYPLQHDRLGRFELFLVPIGADEIGMRYEAVFS